ncbi:hypothetical protein OTU49_016219 [Cherax quadricarinatus]|uniref:Uncharacterized protein n=1 Tax=Cherax quadricarinatus TaxID=27406 RepID=A0AAW0YC91_CHEQU
MYLCNLLTTIQMMAIGYKIIIKLSVYKYSRVCICQYHFVYLFTFYIICNTHHSSTYSILNQQKTNMKHSPENISKISGGNMKNYPENISNTSDGFYELH